MNPEDDYQETFDYIKKLENEIVCSLDDTHLNEYNSNNDIQSFCDILIDKINENVSWTNHFKEEIHHEPSSKLSILPDRSLNNKIEISNQNHSKSNINYHAFLGQTNTENIKIQDEIVWTNNFNKENNQPNGDSKNGNCSTLDLDKGSKYRYSFYANSHKFSIYLADSSLIDRMCGAFSNDNQSKNFSHLQVANNGHLLPDFIEDALIALSKSGMNSIGIFRKSGVKSRINTLKEQINQNKSIDFSSICVYDVADLVKTWLRDLRPHLLTTDLIEMFNKKDKHEFQLWHLDDCHRYLLFVILKFLSIVSSYSQKNQMTTQNLAICFAPSLCDGENEKQINRAQKCLQYCIENYESLFYLNLKEEADPKNLHLKTHTSVIIINASPNDILLRLLYERNVIDQLISRWIINNQGKNSDIFEFDLQFSWLLPAKTFTVERKWGRSKIQDGWELKEIGNMYHSNWIMVPNGKGQTLVKHDISLELRGLSGKWYQSTFNLLHDQQLKNLACSFETSPSKNVTVSDV